MASANLTIVSVAVTVTIKWQFCKTVSLLTCVFCRLSVAFVAFTISVASRQQQLFLDVSTYCYNCWQRRLSS